MAIREQIDVIISARKAKSQSLKSRKAELQAVKDTLRGGYSSLAAQARNITDEKLRRQFMSTLSGIDTRAAIGLVDQLLRKLDEGIRRFDRDYISIATVGKEGQGKSQLLQSIGSLDNDIIPAYNAGSCTGATSIIWNAPELPRGSVQATMTFRQSAELVEIVRPYLLTIDPDYLNGSELHFDEIGYINMVMLENKVFDDPGNADKATALKHLSGIVEHFDEIKSLFGAPPLTLSDPNLIKTYVAQNNGKSGDDPDVEYYYKYLAVARADIRCPFYTDAGRIRLVDTVGLGATQHGIEQAMLDTVDTECDAAIVMTRPVRGVQTTDLELYNMLRNRFKTRNTALWLFYLVNLYKGQNDNTVHKFAQDIETAKWSIVSCRVVDAHDPDEVRDSFLMPMLQTLVDNMEAIDSAYLQEIDVLEKQVHTEIRRFLENLPELQVFDAGSQMGMEAYVKGQKCFNRMTSDLSGRVTDWAVLRDEPNTALWNSVQAILNDLDNIIPSAEQIQGICDRDGSLVGEALWQTVLHYVRNEITDRFIAIDNVLERETLEFKNSLVTRLYRELRQLSAQGVDGEEEAEQVDMVQWLKTMMDRVLSGKDKYVQIRKAFQFLYNFEFNTRAQLIQEVRRQLYIINPICDEYAKPAITFRRATCGREIHFYLTSRMSVIEDELRYHLAKLYRTPNQAFYAAAEEFYDRLTFASDLDGDDLTSMSDIWGQFFQEYSAALWQSDLERYEKFNALVDSYNDMIRGLEQFLAQAGA